MTDSEALLRAVCADPHCDTSRLVLADSLQEQGRDAEADLVRLSVKPTAANQKRRLELERELKPERERWLPNWAAVGALYGGLPGAVKCCVWDLWEDREQFLALLRRFPVEFVSVTQSPQQANGLWWERGQPEITTAYRRWGPALPPGIYNLLAGATATNRFYCPSESVARSVLSQVLLNHFRKQVQLPPLEWGQDPLAISPQQQRRRKQRRRAKAAPALLH